MLVGCVSYISAFSLDESRELILSICEYVVLSIKSVPT